MILAPRDMVQYHKNCTSNGRYVIFYPLIGFNFFVAFVFRSTIFSGTINAVNLRALGNFLKNSNALSLC